MLKYWYSPDCVKVGQTLKQLNLIMHDITRIGCNEPNSDFIIDGNHARMFQNKVAEITKTNQSTVSRWLGTNSENTGTFIYCNPPHLECYN